MRCWLLPGGSRTRQSCPCRRGRANGRSCTNMGTYDVEVEGWAEQPAVCAYVYLHINDLTPLLTSFLTPPHRPHHHTYDPIHHTPHRWAPLLSYTHPHIHIDHTIPPTPLFTGGLHAGGPVPGLRRRAQRAGGAPARAGQPGGAGLDPRPAEEVQGRGGCVGVVGVWVLADRLLGWLVLA